MPRSDDPLVFPSGKIAQDPKRYNMPDAPVAVKPELKPEQELEPAPPEPTLEHAPPSDSGEAPEPTEGLDAPPNTKKWWLIGGGVGLGVITLVVVLLVALGGREPVIAPSPSPSPSPTPSPTEVVDIGFGLLDDGIADHEYPPQAPARGDGFPTAYVMEDWVWDKAGPGWALSVVWGSRLNDYGEPAAGSESWAYLHSPEGVAFELFKLPQDFNYAPAVAGWHEDQRTAWIVAEYGSKAALFDLTTGTPDPLSFKMSSGSSQSVQLATALPDNTELWVAHGNEWTETRVFLHSPYGKWTRVLAQNDFYFSDPWSGVSPDGERVLFNIFSTADSGFTSARSGSIGRPNAVVYDLATGTESFLKPKYPSWPDHCSFTTWSAAGPQVNCWAWNGGSREEYFTVDSAGNLTASAGHSLTPVADLESLAEYTDEPSGIKLVSDIGSMQTFEVRLVRDGEDIVLASPGDRWSRAGIYVKGLTSIGPGVYRIDTYSSGSFLVDTTNGIMTTLVGMYPAPPSGALPFSIVHFGEGSGTGSGYSNYYG